MPNNEASAIRTALLAKLGEVTQLKQVKLGHDLDISLGFPFCRVYLSGVESTQVDNKPSDFRSYRYVIEIIQEYANKSASDAEADFEDAIDAVLDKLNAQWTLGNNADASVIEVSPARSVEGNGGPFLVISIVFAVKTLIG